MNKRERDLLAKIVYHEKFTSDDIKRFSKDEIVEYFYLFKNIKNFSEFDIYKEIIFDHIGKLDKLQGYDSFINIPVNMNEDKLFTLLESDFINYINKHDFTKHYFWTFNRECNKEYLLKYKDYIDWVYVFNNFYNISDHVIDLCIDKISEISIAELLSIVEVLNNKKIDNTTINSYALKDLLNRLENLFNNYKPVDIYNKDTIEHLLKSIKYIKCPTECHSKDEYGYFYEEDIKEFYKNLYKDFDESFIENNIDLFNLDNLIKADKINENILSKYIENKEDIHMHYKYIAKYLFMNKKLSLEFINKYQEFLNQINSIGFFGQKEILNLYKETTDDEIIAKIYLHNEFISDDDINNLLSRVSKNFNNILTKVYISCTPTSLSQKRFNDQLNRGMK